MDPKAELSPESTNVEDRINTILDYHDREIVLVGQQGNTIYNSTPHLGLDVLVKAIEEHNNSLVDGSQAWGINIVEIDKDGKLSVYIKKHGFYYRLDSESFYSLEDLLNKINAAVVGFSFTSKEAAKINEQAQRIKSDQTSPLVIAGGPHPTTAYETLFDDDNFDLAFMGAGEDSLVQLLRNIENENGLNDLQAVATRDQFIPRTINVLRPRMLPNDTRPAFWDRRSVARYQHNQGCLRRCSFCFQRNSDYQLGDIEQAMRFVEDSYGKFDELFFEDGDFSPKTNRKLIERIADFFAVDFPVRSQRFRLGAQMRWDDLVKGLHVDVDIIDLLSRANFKYLFLSVESVSPKVLGNMKKGQLENQDQEIGIGLIKSVFAELRRRKINYGISTIAGYEGDDFESFQTTIKTIFELAPDRIFVEAAKVYPGTGLAGDKDKNDIARFYMRDDKNDESAQQLTSEFGSRLHLASGLSPEDEGCLTLLSSEELQRYYDWAREYLANKEGERCSDCFSYTHHYYPDVNIHSSLGDSRKITAFKIHRPILALGH